MASYLKPRRGTYSTAASKLTRYSDGVLKNGEIFFELNNSGAGKGVGKIKMGDGSTDYSSLPYFLSLQDSTITFTANESTDQISSLASGVTIPNAFRYIKSSLAYLKTQVTNLNNDFVLREISQAVFPAPGGTICDFGTLNTGTYLICVNAQAIGTKSGRYDIYTSISNRLLLTFPNDQDHPCVSGAALLKLDSSTKLEITTWCSVQYTISGGSCSIIKLK